MACGFGQTLDNGGVFGWFRRAPKPERPAWAALPIFAGLDEPSIEAVSREVETRHVSAGEVIVREGDPSFELQMVLRGRLEVSKRDPGSGREHRIGSLGPGDVIGEAGVVGELPRTATVRAVERCELFVLRFHDLRRRAEAEERTDAPLRAAYRGVVENLARLMSQRLRDNAESALASEVRRAAMGQFMVNILIVLCLYVILLGLLPEVSSKLPKSSSFLSIPIQLVFAVGSVSFIRSTGYPLSLFGLSTRHAIGSVLEAIVFTVPFLGVITAVKWLVITLAPAYQNAPLFEHPDVVARLTDPAVTPLLAVYALSSAVQELIVRSALQSSLSMFLTGRRSRGQAILLSALVFSVTHLHMSAFFAALAFLPGVFWGYLYARRPNLLGVSLSHTAVGGYVFFILGTAPA